MTLYRNGINGLTCCLTAAYRRTMLNRIKYSSWRFGTKAILFKCLQTTGRKKIKLFAKTQRHVRRVIYACACVQTVCGRTDGTLKYCNFAPTIVRSSGGDNLIMDRFRVLTRKCAQTTSYTGQSKEAGECKTPSNGKPSSHITRTDKRYCGGVGGGGGCGGNGSHGTCVVGVYGGVERNETNGHHCYLVGLYVDTSNLHQDRVLCVCPTNN